MANINCYCRANGGIRPCVSMQAGFTLVELMVTIALATVLMLIAIPSFVQFQRNARLSEAVSDFMAAANAARANSMKQGVNTYLVPLNTVTVPSTGASWNSGWQVFADANFDKAYSAGTEDLVSSREAIDSSIAIKTSSGSSLNDKYLLFNGSGYPRLTNGAFATATIEFSTGDRTRSVIVDLAGRVRSCKTGESTDCPRLP